MRRSVRFTRYLRNAAPWVKARVLRAVPVPELARASKLARAPGNQPKIESKDLVVTLLHVLQEVYTCN